MRSKSITLVSLSLALTACDSGSHSDPAPPPEPLVTNLGLAVQRQYGQGNVRLLEASEEAQGRDWTGDGDREDVVWQILDLPSATVTNTGLARPPRFGLRDEVPGPGYACNDALAVFQVSEEATGSDLDGDGVLEVLTWTFNRRTGALRSLPFAHNFQILDGDFAVFQAPAPSGDDSQVHVFDGRDGSLTTLATEAFALLAAREGVVAFARHERGAFDLNADGDALDPLVLHLHDLGSGRTWNASFDVSAGPVNIRAGFVGFSVAEALHGGLDLNGDGDATDVVFVTVDGRNGLTRIPGYVAADLADFPTPSSDGFLLFVPEDGRDRNGDGDDADRIALFYDPARDAEIDTGLAGSYPSFLRSGRWIGVPVDELAQGAGDLTGDGLLSPYAAHVFDAVTGRSSNLRLQGIFCAALEDQLLGFSLSPVGLTELFVWDPRNGTKHFPGLLVSHAFGVGAGSALLLTPEFETDLNDDGDELDVVLARYDARTRSVHGLRLATDGSVPALGSHRHAAVLVPEAAQGDADLNGDGDTGDVVLHLVVLDPSQP